MTTGFNLWDVEVWVGLLGFAALLAVMLLANVIRRTVKLINKMMIPSPVLGGFMLLLILWGLRTIAGDELIPSSFFEILTYHGFGLGFAAISLKAFNKAQDKNRQRDFFNTSLLTVSTYIIQGVVGLALSIGLFYIIGSFAVSGMLMPIGYGQGPGQAFNWGTIYQNEWGFEHGASFGLSIAAVSYLAASIGGVYYLSKLRRKRNPKVLTKFFEEESEHEVADISPRGEVPLADSLDKLTIQFALVFLAYSIGFSMISLFSWLCELSGAAILVETVKPLLWGFNFVFAAVSAILLRTLLSKLKNKSIIKQTYTNNILLDRVAGVLFDMMVVAAIAAISIASFREPGILIPLAVLCTVVGFVSYFYIHYVATRLFPSYPEEAFLACFGMLVGMASTGVILLREIDARFETPACLNLIYHAPYSVMMGFPILLLMGFAPQSGWMFPTLAILTVMFVVFFVWIRFTIKRVQREHNKIQSK
ncbi:MAG: hypothetical protein LBD23_11330 [Oscillospiraceae bacterium]|jgi:ESS family glutamate:Na+ symporter|nr:hypothetical protein [Oscillospiraceae bacterium]